VFDPDALRRLGWASPARFIAPCAGEAHLWLVRVPPAHIALDALLAHLSPAEQARAPGKRIEAKRREYVAGQATLRVLLARALGIAPAEVAYRRGIKGKPYLAAPLNAAGIMFNITHSGEMVMLALSVGAELGVDVEWRNERTDPERVARRAFGAHERAALAVLTPVQRRAHFFQIWTCKEALVKCTGLGIHSGMAQFQVALDGHGARLHGAHGRQAGVERLHVVPLALGEDHAGALVHEPPALRLRCMLLDALPDPLAGI